MNRQINKIDELYKNFIRKLKITWKVMEKNGFFFNSVALLKRILFF